MKFLSKLKLSNTRGGGTTATGTFAFLNWSIKTQLRIGFGALLLCAIGVGASGLFAASKVQTSVTTAKTANELLGDIPKLLNNAKDFDRTGTTESADAVRTDLATVSEHSTHLSKDKPEAAQRLLEVVDGLGSSFDTLTQTRKLHDTAVADLDALTANIAKTTSQAFEDYKALEAYRASLAITNEGKMNNLSKIAPRLGNMRIATILLEQEAAAFVATPDKASAKQLTDRVKTLGKDAKAVRRTAKSKDIKSGVKKLTKGSKSFEKLIKAHLKAGAPDTGGTVWKKTFQPAVTELTTNAQKIIEAAEAPVEELRKELRAFESASKEIALLSNKTQSIARNVLGVRSAYADYLNTSEDQAAQAFQGYLAQASSQLEELSKVRATAAKDTKDKAYRDLLNGPLKTLVEAGSTAFPQLDTTFAEVVSSTQAQHQSQKTFAEAANSLSEQVETISHTLGQTAVASASAARTQIIVTLAFALVLGIACVVVLTGAIIRPIRGLTSAMMKLQDGETDLDLSADSRSDEIGDMARAVGTFRDREQERVRLEAETEASAEAARQRQQSVDSLWPSSGTTSRLLSAPSTAI